MSAPIFFSNTTLPPVTPNANLLLYAYDPKAAQHEASRVWLDVTLSGSALVRVAWSTLWAILRIATSPRVFHGDRVARILPRNRDHLVGSVPSLARGGRRPHTATETPSTTITKSSVTASQLCVRKCS